MLSELVKIAREAGTILLKERLPNTLRSRDKADGSPVTNGDLAAHAFLEEALSTRFALPIVSEEGTGPLVAPDAGTFFLVDPLDGTKEFIKGLDEFCVCIALISEARPTLGIIHAPALQETYFAEAAKGAFRVLRDQAPERLPLRRAPELVLARSRFHESPLTDQFAAANGIRRSLTVGSALKFARLATGEATVLFRDHPSWEWDIAAGHILLTESGGTVSDLTTLGEITYRNPTLLTPGLIACAAGIAVSQLRLPKKPSGG
jgi:3'(2'), 5'-bisphosphate nucleotidase